jgi:hypothetical protein
MVHQRDAQESFREPSSHERAIIAKLLEADFVGRADVAIQLADFKVRPMDENGSSEILTRDDAPVAKVSFRCPVEAQTLDLDGMKIVLALHVVDGRVQELEVFRIDSQKVLGSPDAATLDVIGL